MNCRSWVLNRQRHCIFRVWFSSDSFFGPSREISQWVCNGFLPETESPGDHDECFTVNNLFTNGRDVKEEAAA